MESDLYGQIESMIKSGEIFTILKQKIRFNITGGPYGDSTCHYDVAYPKGTKVMDIIAFALTQDEWGYVRVKKGGVTHELEYARGMIDNKQGRIVSDNIPEEIKNLNVKKLESHGGWSRMDYLIKA